MKQHICKFWFLLCVAVLSIGMTVQSQLIWTNGPAMSTPRGHHTATVLKDGRSRLQGGQVDMGAYEQNADLSITPVTGLNTAGHQEGPFNPPAKMYTLINESEDEATWVVVKTQNWLDVSPTGGVLAVGANTHVTVAINRQANTLPVGVYTNLVLFSNVNTAVTQTRKVTLTVFTSPEIYVSSPWLDVTNALSQVTCRALTIGNSGDAPLHYTIRSWQTGYTPLEAPHDVAQSRIEGNSMVLEYAFGKPIVEKRGEYDSIRIEGLRDYLRVGAPILPVRPVTLLVPYGKKVTGVRVMVVKGAKLEGLYRLPPAQPPYPLSRPDAVKAMPPDSAIYGKAVPWPGRYHEKLDTQSKRGYQLLTLSLLPLQYTPPTGQIEYVERLRVEVTLADMDAAAVLRVGGQGEPSIASRVDNPQTMGTYPFADRPSRSKTGGAMLPTGGPYQYVIITTPELAASSSPWNFQALCDARTAQGKGMSATMVTTDWIYAHYSGTRPDGGTDNQTRIRNFLIDAYQTWGTRYALLGGVSTLVPARLFWVDSHAGEVDEMPVDMYYGCVEPAACTFDGDGDGLYGEPTDGVGGGDVDLEAEIYVGRAAVEDATELANFVRKTLTYQQTPSEYLPQITMLGEYLGFLGVSDYATEMMEQIRLGGTYDGYSTCGFENHARLDFVDFNTSNNLYDAPAYNWPKANLIALMNAGTHVLNHLGHANQMYTMKLNNSDLSSLTNTDYFFAYSQGCMPGWFDSSDCFAEEITAMEHGAFAVVMNARYGWGRFYSTDGPSERFDRQYWDAVLGENMLELGRANQDSKEDNLWDINGDCIRWCYYELNLFGDPAQQFRFVDSAEWIATTSESGTVPPGASTNLEVCFDAGKLNPGVYQGEIALASDDLDTPSIDVSCAMTVLPDDLRLSPSSDFSASGYQGGPFSPSNMVYQLTNMGRSNLTWTATCSSNWISLTRSGGTLAAGASEVITVRISSVANRLPVGVYGDRLTFSNGNNGVIQCRSVLLDVIPIPPTIVTIDFDKGFTTGAQTPDFLSAYGISNVTFSGAPGAMGPWIIDGTVGNTIPSSEPNALMQWLSATDPGQIHRLTFLFSSELKEFSLTRAGRFGGSSTDTWIARFFNSSNVELGSFGESTPLINPPPKKFTFTAPPGETISRMDLESVYTGFATTATVPVDDFVLVFKAAQTIDFPNPGPQFVTNQVGLSATASSGLPVSFAVESGPGTLADRTNLTFMGIGTVVIVASQAGDENWNPAPNVTNMILVAEEDSDIINLALASRGSTITGNNGADWSNLIDGVTNGYTGDTGFGYTYWNITPPGTMTLDLKDSYTITCIKLLLWDLDDRYYQYKIEASIDNKTWTLIVDRTAATNQCRSWQDISFSPAIQARYLRLTGTYNSANIQFHVVEWEVYGSPALTILTSADVVTVPEGDRATFQVKLSTAPVDPTTVTVSRVSGDTDISVQLGGSLVFNYSNWSNYRTVTLGAAEDADWVNDTAVIRCSAPGLTDKDVTATEEDGDVINLALASRGSTITGSNGADWSNLIDGVTNGYTGDTGFGYTYWNITPPGTMTLDLKDSYMITCTKLLLWDLDDRYYQYKIEASIDNKTWTLIVDRTAATNQCRSWQDISFSPAIQARYLRLTGTYNSANIQFHVVEWEVYGSPALTILTSADVVTVPEGDRATFQVKLSTAPVDPTTVTVSRVSGDTDISVQLGGSLVFNYSNWSNYRTVTLGAAEDADWVNDTAVIRCSAPGLTDKDVTATEEDGDVINLALASRGSTITGSNGADWSNLIDGVTNGYTGDTGFGYTYWNITPPGTMTLDLKDSYMITCTKLLLWDLDDRYYQYKIEASIDNKTWTLIVDRTAATNQCRSWQDISFSPAIQARYLRLTGTYNSANIQFHVVEWEVYGSPALTILTSADVVTVPEGDRATFQVKLSTAPVDPTTVTVSRVSGDTDISVQLGGSLVFNYSNWSNYRTVTLGAAEDADWVNDTAVIRCSAPGLTDKDVTAAEQDNDGVVPPNNLPIALSQTLGAPKDTIIALTLMAEDQEGDKLSYRITSGPAHGTLDTNEAPNVMYTPNPGYVGSDEFRFVANDGKLDSSEAIMTLNVTSNSVLSIACQQKLNRYAAATARYFTSAQANNTNTAFTHAFYGIGPYQKKDDNGTWRTNDLLPRGYGSHVNMNEVTMRFLSLATAYKMNWLDHIAPTQRYARSWGAILTGLQTIRSMQTSGNVNQYVANTFHHVYQTTTYHNAPDQDRTVAETVCSSGVNEQSSDDNALPFANLLLLQGLASDPAVTTIVDRVAITNLCRQIRDAINLRRFLVKNRVVMNYTNGLPNTNAIWNRVSVEGSLILGAMLLQGQIGTNKSYGINTNEFYAAAPSLENHPVWWSNRLSGATTYVGKPSYHAAIYAHGLRAMHGMPVTAAEFTTNVNFFVTSLKPVTEAQIDYADGYDLKALGSQVMSQPLRGVPVFERNGVQVQFPGNESNRWPDPSNDLAVATGPHAWFVPLQRWRYLNLDQLDIDYIFAWAGEYETNFFHVAGDPDTQLGWEAAVPFKPEDTRYAWRASDGSWKYTDWGRPYEALNAGYSVLSIFDALNPDKPLSAYNVEALRWGYIAQYLDSNVRLPSVLFPR